MIDLEDVEMRIEFRTRCPRCGALYCISSSLMVAEPSAFKNLIESVRLKLSKEPRICCNKKLPEISGSWGRIWPE